MDGAFGRYTLLRRLAVGGMAEIFLADLHSDAGFAKRVVLKRILPHLNEDPDFVKMFIDEAMVAAKLSHPNIIQVHDFGCVSGSYFIAMEYVDGVDLNSLLHGTKAHNTPLSAASVAALGERVARGLSYTHELVDEHGRAAGIVHRDISPHNIMVTRQGDVKVMDFGIAKAAARASRTTTGTIKGKLAYMAPEQAAGEQASAQSDQFSLGIVLWECLSGHRLFTADTEVSLIKRVQSCEIPPLCEFRSDVSAALESIVRRALQREPHERFANLRAMQEALMGFRFALGAGGIVKLDALIAAHRPPEQPVQSWSYQARAAGGTRRLFAAAPALAVGAQAAAQPDALAQLQQGVTPSRPITLGGLRHRKLRLWPRGVRPGFRRRAQPGSVPASAHALLRWRLVVGVALLVLGGLVGCALGVLRAH